mmetsp:Transcript_3869/g.6843  ORF Transcript_3869/g.6843 Transcript_3869/m.6843 type:complete len:110 (-) Transcript_3869:1157-1486(-)
MVQEDKEKRRVAEMERLRREHQEGDGRSYCNNNTPLKTCMKMATRVWIMYPEYHCRLLKQSPINTVQKRDKHHMSWTAVKLRHLSIALVNCDSTVCSYSVSAVTASRWG